MSVRVTLENGIYGRRAIVTSEWSNEISRYVKDHGIVELELNMAKGWRGTDLSFLSDVPHLQAFDILDLAIKNIEGIHFLHGLKRLGVTTYCSTEIKFSEFPELESCALEWRPRAKSLFDCVTLKKLFVNRYKGKDTEPFGKLVNLESLSILNAPVTNLEGLRPLSKLRHLRLGALRRLTSLAGLESLTSLEELNINTCRSFGSIEEVGSLTRLRKFYLNNCGNIESLKPIEKLSGLEAVIFWESTNILDGDISPLMRQKNLSNISFKNRRHYSHRQEDFGIAYSGGINGRN